MFPQHVFCLVFTLKGLMQGNHCREDAGTGWSNYEHPVLGLPWSEHNLMFNLSVWLEILKLPYEQTLYRKFTSEFGQDAKAKVSLGDMFNTGFHY